MDNDTQRYTSVDNRQIEENTQNLIKFLRELADLMQQGSLSDMQKQRVGEFFIKYKFQEQADKDSIQDQTIQEVDFTEEEFMKFFSMGWYVYRILKKDEKLQ